MAIKTPRRFKNRHGIYGVRFIVPMRARAALGKKEIRLSLRTRCPELSRQLALQFNLELERAVAMSKLPSTSNKPIQIDWTMTAPNGMVLKADNAADQKRMTSFIAESPGMAKAIADAFAAPAVLTGVTPANSMAVAEPSPFNDLCDAHLVGLESLSPVAARTVIEKRRALERFAAYLWTHHELPEDAAVDRITSSMVLGFLEDYARRPARGGVVRPLSGKTTLKLKGHLSQFFEYAMAKGAIRTNPLLALKDQLKRVRSGAKSKKNRYRAFTQSELGRIFEPSSYLAKMNAADTFWAPLLSLTTGARLGELVTLEVSDILQEPDTGIWTVGLRDEEVKNDHSIRRVPISQQLIDIGFLAYHAHMAQLGTELLFPFRKFDGPTWQLDPSKTVSRVFAAYLDRLGIIDSTKVFHSFRHTAITMLNVRGVPIGDAMQIVGHSAQEEWLQLGDSTHVGTYNHAGDVQVGGESLGTRLKDHIDRSLVFPLQWSALAAAAQIVLRHVRLKDQSTKKCDTGWHTNAHDYAAAMLAQLNTE